jgi:hypothetical protein
LQAPCLDRSLRRLLRTIQVATTDQGEGELRAYPTFKLAIGAVSRPMKRTICSRKAIEDFGRCPTTIVRRRPD